VIRTSFTGAVSGTWVIATKPTATAPIMYQAGASGLPVNCVSHATTNWVEPPNTEIASRLYRVTRERSATPETPATLELAFDAGTPVSVNGVRLPFIELLDSLDTIVGVHGVGRFDGLSGPYSAAYDAASRHVGEAPAVLVLGLAYDALERRLWPAELVDLKQQLAVAFRSLVRRGKWFSPTRRAISAFVGDAQHSLTGSVRLELFKGACRVKPDA